MTTKTADNRVTLKGSLSRIDLLRSGEHVLTFDVLESDQEKPRTIHPVLRLPAGRSHNLQTGTEYVVRGHTMSELKYRPARGKMERLQYGVADWIAPAAEADKRSAFYGVHLTGKLLRIFETGASWCKLLIEIPQSNTSEPPRKIMVGVRKWDRSIPKVRDLQIGESYAVYCTLSSPEDKREEGRYRNDLVARRITPVA